LLSSSDLTADQREAVEFMHANPFSALFLDVGFGKTVISLTVLRRLIRYEGYRDKVLIVAPIRVANRVWPQEPRLWAHLAWMDVRVLRIEDSDPRLTGAPRRARTALKDALRTELLDTPEQLHVINPEALDWLVTKWAERRRWPYKVVVFDESSRLRDHNSVTFKALRKVRSHVVRLHELTATPASQSYMALFSQVWLLDKGDRFGNHITPFREQYFIYNHYARTWRIRPGAEQVIERQIADICLVMRRKRDFVTRVREIELPVDVMGGYRQFERELVLELHDAEIDAINAAVLCGKLLQYASGFVYDADRKVHEIHDEKIEELRLLAEETLDEPVMVAYWYKGTLARLRAAFPHAAVMDREGTVVESWNRREHKMMFVHPQSAGHGLNLQHGGRHLAVVDMFYSLELYTQLVGRLDRTGQTDTVMVHLLCAAGTIDTVVAHNLQRLRNAEDDMMRRLQELRRELTGADCATGKPRSGITRYYFPGRIGEPVGFAVADKAG
jgi:hypothetical protein